jgi:hypothetical protein
MNPTNHARILALALLAGATLAGASAMSVHASKPEHSTKSSCEAAGFEWDAVKGCADQSCTTVFGYGQPGEYVYWMGKLYVCDGWTGTWSVVGLVRNGPVNATNEPGGVGSVMPSSSPTASPVHGLPVLPVAGAVMTP